MLQVSSKTKNSKSIETLGIFNNIEFISSLLTTDEAEKLIFLESLFHIYGQNFDWKTFLTENQFISKDLKLLIIEKYFAHNHSEFAGKLYLNFSNNKIIQKFIEQFKQYPIKDNPILKYNTLIIKPLLHHYEQDSNAVKNLLNLEDCRLEIIEGNLCDKNHDPFSTNKKYIYVIDHEGNIFVSSFGYHNFILHDQGFGAPVACAGHIEIYHGKITNIDNQSGHYQPNQDQLILVIKFLHNMGVIDHRIIIKDFDGDRTISLSIDDILKSSILEILNNYPEFETSSPFVYSQEILGDQEMFLEL